MPRADKKSMRVRHGNDRAGGIRRVGGADRQHQALGKARRPPTAESQAKMMDDGVEPPRPAPNKEHGLVKAFGEKILLRQSGASQQNRHVKARGYTLRPEQGRSETCRT
jgi:hypothetical protein